jgi:SAM-dependent methyltransferase
MPLAGTFLRRVLAHPLTASLDLDDPATTALRKHIIASKPFLKRIYDEWYTTIATALPVGGGKTLEIGSGAGYCSQFISDLIRSEVFACPGIDLVLDAQRMPFADGSLRAIVMTNVLHHLPQAICFFAEASRCLRPGGKILMIEPWVTRWSKFVYTRFHHEPFDPESKDWSLPVGGPLSAANGALPWILFVRDREKFEYAFPDLIVEEIRPFLPFRYLVSGGVGMRSLMPGFAHRAWFELERVLRFRMSDLAMFAFISVRRR